MVKIKKMKTSLGQIQSLSFKVLLLIFGFPDLSSDVPIRASVFTVTSGRIDVIKVVDGGVVLFKEFLLFGTFGPISSAPVLTWFERSKGDVQVDTTNVDPGGSKFLFKPTGFT